jgi:hypothetical protein
MASQVGLQTVGGGLAQLVPGNLNPAVQGAPIGGTAAGGNVVPGNNLGGNAIPGNNLGVVDTLEALVQAATSSDPTQP